MLLSPLPQLSDTPPCGAARYDVNMVEAEARRLVGDAEASFEDRFHHDALSVVPQAMLQSDIRHFVFALPLAHILEKKLRVERAVRLGRVVKNRPHFCDNTWIVHEIY
jgi:hypothetical protein